MIFGVRGCRMILRTPLSITQSIAVVSPVIYSRENMPSEEAFPCPSKEIGGSGESKYEV